MDKVKGTLVFSHCFYHFSNSFNSLKGYPTNRVIIRGNGELFLENRCKITIGLESPVSQTFLTLTSNIENYMD